MDASGKAATCLLYQLGSREAVTMARELNPRIPMDRRRIALAYAVARAPGSALATTIKMGFAMGLWSAVLADPNNPSMRRSRRHRPSRRTLSVDLNWLEERKVLKRWQVEMEHAAPCERKQNPNYPTNRYFAPVRRGVHSMFEICVAIGDVPPVAPNPSEEWTDDDADAMGALRASLMEELGRAKAEPRPPPASHAPQASVGQTLMQSEGRGAPHSRTRRAPQALGALKQVLAALVAPDCRPEPKEPRPAKASTPSSDSSRASSRGSTDSRPHQALQTRIHHVSNSRRSCFPRDRFTTH